jgi:hypothetical protein
LFFVPFVPFVLLLARFRVENAKPQSARPCLQAVAQHHAES